MSGHHPPSWNNHPMQVPPYIPRQLPMAHMSSNERPMSGPWHNSGGPPIGAPPQSGLPGPEHNQYPYMPANNRKHAMDMNPHLPLQYSRHGMMGPAIGDYDSPMMDLSVSSAMRNNNQFNSGGYNNSSGEHLTQDYSNKLNRSMPGGYPEVPANGTNNAKEGMMMMDSNLDNFRDDILSRRQNPIGLPPMSEPMELVKEALLKTIKSQAPSFSGTGMSPHEIAEQLMAKAAIESSCQGVNLTCANDHPAIEASPVVPGKEQSRRRTRKPNKTSKVVNEETSPSLGRSSTEMEESLDENGDTINQKEDQQEGFKTPTKDVINSPSSATKRPSQESSPAKGPEESSKKRKRNRRSNDSAESPAKENSKTEPSTPPIPIPNDLPVVDSNGTPAKPQKEEQDGAADKPPADPDASFEEVESKLTEMFAGITDSEATMPLADSSVLTTTATETKKKKKKPPAPRRKSTSLALLVGEKDIEMDSDDEEFCLAPQKPKKKRGPSKKGAGPSKANGSGNGVNNGGGNKKRGSKSGKQKNKNLNKKEDEIVVPKKPPKDTEESRYRGPSLQVRQDGSLNVLNGPQGQTEDDPDVRNGVKVKKFLHNGGERNKVLRGLHASTLSMKYDTDRTDTTWICVFCKLGPHKMGLGDLFGPYMTTTDCDEFRLMQACGGDPFKSNRKRMDMVQTAPHRLPAVPAGAAGLAALKSPKMGGPAKRGPKKKQRLSAEGVPIAGDGAQAKEEDMYFGLTKATENSYEIWMHEDCIVWGSGIHMIAGRLVGLEEAVWSSTSSRCSLCKKAGAVVCCLQRGCSEKVHVPCGKQSNWTLDGNLLNSYCQQHKGPPAVVSREGGAGGEVKTVVVAAAVQPPPIAIVEASTSR